MTRMPSPRHPRRHEEERYGANRYDEDEDDDSYLFEDKYIRHEFIRKVYSILFVQLLITLGIILTFRFHRPLCLFVLGYYSKTDAQIFWYSCLGGSMVVIIMLVCCSSLRHKFPINLILLGLFTIIEGMLLGGMTCYSRTDIFLMAVGITSAVVVALSLFAIQTRWDFTVCMGGMIVFMVVLMVMGIVCIFVKDKILHLVYAGLGTMIFCMYLVIDTQMIMGGNRRYALSPDEYILGALHLYLDIIMIFMYLYALLSGASQ